MTSSETGDWVVYEQLFGRRVKMFRGTETACHNYISAGPIAPNGGSVHIMRKPVGGRK